MLITETPRLKIRKLSIHDAEFVLALTNEPSTIENIGDKGLRSVADAEKFILDGPWIKHQKPGYGQFAIELKHSGDLIGVCGLLHRDKLNLTDVGFALKPEYWRQGFGYEAAEAVMNYGYFELGLKTIAGLTSGTNIASINLLKKLGMSFQKMVNMSGDSPATTCVYSKPRADSIARQKADTR